MSCPYTSGPDWLRAVGVAVTPNPGVVIDGLRPEHLLLPESAAEVADLLRQASAGAAPLIPVGGGTRLALGEPPPAGVELLLSLERLDQVVEYDADNLTLTVGAGVKLAEIERVTRPRKLFLALDVPRPETATAGGLVATNASGPRRARYGAPRDLVLGMQVALTSGELIRAGGKTVKNVAGYDMCKLFTGALGTLGVIVAVTFRLRPRPELSETLIISCETVAAAGELAARLLSSAFAPAAVELAQRSALARAELEEAPREEWSLVLALEGEVEAVARQRREIFALAPGALTVPEETARGLWTALAEICVSDDEDTVLRAVVPLARASGLAGEAAAAARQTGIAASCLAHLGDGTVYLRLRGGEGLISLGRQMRERVAHLGGHLVIEAAPAQVKRDLGVWGAEPAALALMKRLKEKFDPAGILNPGRFVGGI